MCLFIVIIVCCRSIWEILSIHSNSVVEFNMSNTNDERTTVFQWVCALHMNSHYHSAANSRGLQATTMNSKYGNLTLLLSNPMCMIELDLRRLNFDCLPSIQNMKFDVNIKNRCKQKSSDNKSSTIKSRRMSIRVSLYSSKENHLFYHLSILKMMSLSSYRWCSII
jgi:hypothetical protein